MKDNNAQCRITDGVLEEWLCKNASSIIIPKSVKEIDLFSFDDCETIENVSFEGTVAEWEKVCGKRYLVEGTRAKTVSCKDGEWILPVLLITDGVLERCYDKKIENVVVPHNVLEIHNRAFLGIEPLKSTHIMDGTEKICFEAFRGCKNLSTITLPATLKEIDDMAFYGCTSLLKVEFSGTKAQWECVKGKINLLDFSKTKAVSCKDGEWTLPAFIISGGMLEKCTDPKITDAIIPEGVSSIANGSFRNNPLLERVVIPQSVKTIGRNAFANCKNLKSVLLAEGLETLGDGAFFNDEAVSSIHLPGTLKRIEDHSFNSCTALKEISFAGTKSEWALIDIGFLVWSGVLSKTVSCKDGNADLAK